MKERIKKLLPRLLYPAVYLVVFPIGLSLTFPYEYVRDLIVTEFNSKSASGNSHDELRIDSLAGYWVSGVEMKGLRLSMASSDPSKPPNEWVAERAAARVSVMPLLIGHKNVNFNADLYGGTVEGSFSQHGGDTSLDVTLSGIDFGAMKALVDIAGLPVDGRVSGTIKIEVPEGKVQKASGAIALTVDSMAVGDGKTPLKAAMGMALPKVNIGAVTIAGDILNGSLKWSKLGASGKDVEVVGEGKVVLAESPMDGRAEMTVRFKINDSFIARSDIAKSLFEAPGGKGSPLFEMDAKVKQSKRADGFYGWNVNGAFKNLNFAPAGNGH